MAKRLTQEAIQTALNDSDLYKTITDILGIVPGSTYMTIKRNGPPVNRYDIVEAIANKMGVQPDDIMEEVKLVSKRKPTRGAGMQADV